MRSVPSDIASKLAMKKQTRANSADPSASIWIGRPTTPLTTDVFLEKQTVLTGASITDTSVAVCHHRQGATNTKINMAYIDNGVARVLTASVKAKMSNHNWVNSGFEENATAVSIAYDGTMPKNDRGTVEFVTEDKPWVFWISGGAMYARKLGSSTTISLAESNCTDVSAIRAMWSEVGGFDFGLVVFFLLNGTIYYRQLIGGEWKDAEIVTFGPSGVTWSSIAAFRTWDYRVGIQGKTTTGDIYELFTQFMGVGKQNVEHLEVKNVLGSTSMLPVTYHNTREYEHLEITSASNAALYGGLYNIAMPVLIEAYNINDGDDWGKILVMRFTSEVNGVEANNQTQSFNFIDSWGVIYSPSSIVTTDGRTLYLYFVNFNNARGSCTARYVPGTVHSMYGDSILATSITFTPINLVPSEIPLPEVEEIWNE